MDPPPQVFFLTDDETQFSFETVSALEILSEFMSLTEFPGVLWLHEETKIPEEFLLRLKNHVRVFFSSEVSFADTFELSSQISTVWEEVDTGVSIYLDSEPIGNRKRFRSQTSEGNFFVQQFSVDTIIPAERTNSLCKDERTRYLFFKLQKNHLCEVVKLPHGEPPQT